MNVEPKAIADLVESYVRDAYSDASKFENSSLLDESGVWTLHRLAAEIYAAGFDDGQRIAEVHQRGERQRAADLEQTRERADLLETS